MPGVKVDSGLDVVVEAVDTAPSVPSFKQHIFGLFYHRHIVLKYYMLPS